MFKTLKQRTARRLCIVLERFSVKRQSDMSEAFFFKKKRKKKNTQMPVSKAEPARIERGIMKSSKLLQSQGAFFATLCRFECQTPPECIWCVVFIYILCIASQYCTCKSSQLDLKHLKSAKTYRFSFILSIWL